MSEDTTTTDTSGSTTSKLPSWIKEQGPQIVSRGQELFNRPYEANPFATAVPTLASQTQQAWQIGANAPNFYETAINPARQLTVNAGDTSGGGAGAMAQYGNPYIQAALQPAIREIQQAGALQRQGIGGQATQAGAFGDARHGIVEAEQMRGEQRNIGDITGKMYGEGWDKAQAQRQAEQNRLLQAAGQLGDFAETSGSQQLKSANLLNTIGSQQQAIDQQYRDLARQQWETQRNYPQSQINQFMSTLQGVPYEKTTSTSGTSATTQPGSSSAGLIGSLLGAFF